MKRPGLRIEEPRPGEDPVVVVEEARQIGRGPGTRDPADREQRDQVVAARHGEAADVIVVEDLEGPRADGAARVMASAASAAAAPGRRRP